MIVLDTKDEGLSTFQSLQGQLHGMGQADAAAKPTVEALETQAAALQSSQPAVAANLLQQASAIRAATSGAEAESSGTVFGVQKKHALFIGLGAIAGYFIWDRYIR